MPLSAGVNVSPLMASVGGIGVAVGLATQSVATNVVSALSLFASRPFVVGDRVQLMKGGAVVVEGKVEHIEPMRTVLRDPEGNPSEWDTACAGMRRHAPIRWQLCGLACAALVCVLLCCAVLCMGGRVGSNAGHPSSATSTHRDVPCFPSSRATLQSTSPTPR